MVEQRVAGLTSIVIPAWNAERWVRDAIGTALAQTAPVEVIVVDDGSTDGTLGAVLEIGDQRLVCIRLPHGGPSVARNAGIEAARGEFLMLLDADDIIEPTKVAEQVAAMTDDVGWVLSDVLIVDAIRGRAELASARYRYAERNLGGWIQDQLAPANFIPIMSPLVRMSVIDATGIRFGDRAPEDWHFWYKLSGHARCRYLPRVLSTYRKRPDGRNTARGKLEHVSPARDPVAERLLNLGCGTRGTRSWHPMPGCVNLDKSMGWRFEDGLTQYWDASVDGITISHALMYVVAENWPALFKEFARVLRPGGVLRITEDDTENPQSSRYGGWRGSQPAVAQTSARLVLEAMAAAGLHASEVTRDTSARTDKALSQAQHGEPPNVFFAEGLKPGVVLLSPHNDDETLFAAFTIMAHAPHVVVCFPSSRDYGEPAVREAETRAALGILGAPSFEQWDGKDVLARLKAMDARCKPSVVWAPSPLCSHPDHVEVADAAMKVFGTRLRHYHTYDVGADKWPEKVRLGDAVPVTGHMVKLKLRALLAYESQINHPRARMFFVQDLAEYVDLLGNKPEPARIFQGAPYGS